MTSPSIDSIVSLYANWGTERYDEDLSQIDHALQCASLASNDGASDQLIAAALLHDIGHLFEISRNNGPDHSSDLEHEMTGAEFLAAIFPESVTVPIALHVKAKRYLAATDPAYVEQLSHGSIRSLAVQGGPFTESECADFIAQPGGRDAVVLRRWDDHAKVIDLEVADFDGWIGLLERVAAR